MKHMASESPLCSAIILWLSWPQVQDKLNALSMAVGANDVPVIRALLQQLVSGYQPSGEVVDWVQGRGLRLYILAIVSTM